MFQVFQKGSTSFLMVCHCFETCSRSPWFKIGVQGCSGRLRAFHGVEQFVLFGVLVFKGWSWCLMVSKVLLVCQREARVLNYVLHCVKGCSRFPRGYKGLHVFFQDVYGPCMFVKVFHWVFMVFKGCAWFLKGLKGASGFSDVVRVFKRLFMVSRPVQGFSKGLTGPPCSFGTFKGCPWVLKFFIGCSWF